MYTIFNSFINVLTLLGTTFSESYNVPIKTKSVHLRACALCGILLSACPRSAWHNSINTHQNENRFLAFGSLTSNADVEVAMISVCITVNWNIIVAFLFLFSILYYIRMRSSLLS